jgi:hypothetical protein
VRLLRLPAFFGTIFIVVMVVVRMRRLGMRMPLLASCAVAGDKEKGCNNYINRNIFHCCIFKSK